MNLKKGQLEVICGSMFSGKSEELIRRLRRAQIAKRNTLAFKHNLDGRKSLEHLVSHNGSKIHAFAVDKATMVTDLIPPEIEVVGIDEIQFFSNDVIGVVQELVDAGKRVICAGLDLDFRGVPFSCIPGLMAIADTVTKFNAICMQCGNDAHFTQRLINGKPAKHTDPLIMVGAQECYEARCRNCFVIDKVPTWYHAQI